jgi:hypothetical protein
MSRQTDQAALHHIPRSGGSDQIDRPKADRSYQDAKLLSGGRAAIEDIDQHWQDSSRKAGGAYVEGIMSLWRGRLVPQGRSRLGHRLQLHIMSPLRRALGL